MTKDEFNKAFEKVYDLPHKEVRGLSVGMNLADTMRALHAIKLLEKEGVQIDDWECYFAQYLFPNNM